MEKRNLAAGVISLCMFLLLGSGASGGTQWEQDGIAVGVGVGNQRSPGIVSDGLEGAIIAWSDGDIHAQRIDGSGIIQWPTNGIVICAASGEQGNPRIVSDGSGGAIILWSDARSSITIPYIQRINANGTALWAPNGRPICAADSSQLFAELIADGAGGAIMAWEDMRAGNSDIYAQKIDAAGNILWGESGLAVCAATGDQGSPQLASDGSGGAIIAWEDGRTGESDIFAQRIALNGMTSWAIDGICVCNAGSYQYSPRLAPDGSGGAIIAWGDGRMSGFGPDVYAQRVDGSGLAQWATNGIEVGTGNAMSLSSLEIVSDGSNGANIAWGDFSATAYVQRLDVDGNALWEAGGLSLYDTLNPHSQWEPRIISDGAGGIVVTYWLYVGGNYEHDIYAQKVDGEGNILWTAGGVGMCMIASDQRSPQITSDGIGGAIVAWEDWRDGDTDVYALRINSAGRVSTLLQSYSAAASGSYITITWTVSEICGDCRFNILRTMPGTDVFEQLRDPRIENRGLSFEFRDNSCELGKTYRYRIEVLGEGTRVALFETEEITLPAPSLILFQNHPNPFRRSTNIPFVLHERTEARLSIYDIKGRLVTVLLDDTFGEGPKEISWDGRDALGNPVASGIYFYRLKAGSRILTKKALLLK